MQNKLMWCVLVHLGYNMWPNEITDELIMEKPMWDEYMPYLRASGVDTLLIDIGEGLKYETHPELAVRGSWNREYFLKEMQKLRDMGFEIIPKLNFSTSHDFWLKDYARMVSSRPYYEACRELIDEVCSVLHPKHFHLGMDEEDGGVQAKFNLSIVRQNDLWWHDLYFYQNCVERNNARAWVWSDYMCDHKDEYLRKMPKEVMQNPWFYLTDFENKNPAVPLPARNWISRRIDAFRWLSEAGYDQVPTGSNIDHRPNLEMLARFCRDNVSTESLKGFMQTPWKPMQKEWKQKYWEAADTVRETKALFE